jgi:HAD superfamily hydrolase (TIGR01549 family)
VPAILGPSAEERDGEKLREAVGELYPEVVAELRPRAFDGVLELLDALRARGLKIALATSSSMEHLTVTLEQAGSASPTGATPRRLDALVNKDDVEASKPEPDVVLAAVSKLGLTPAECAMVGDTPFDAIAARRAGVVTLGVLCGGI